ncbi:MAG: arsenate reductase (glutaredoxin) [Vicingaceae bacterium]
MKIYHNPRCRKSRETLKLLEENSSDIEIIEYLKTPPSYAELKDVLMKLNMPASGLIRKSEAIFKEKFKGKEFSEEEWIQVMVENPKLIERPIVVRNNKAVIGRPPENVEQLF